MHAPATAKTIIATMSSMSSDPKTQKKNYVSYIKTPLPRDERKEDLPLGRVLIVSETPSLQITPAVVFMHACVTTVYSLSGFRPPSVHCKGPPGGIVQVAFSELLVTMVTS